MFKGERNLYQGAFKFCISYKGRGDVSRCRHVVSLVGDCYITLEVKQWTNICSFTFLYVQEPKSCYSIILNIISQVDINNVFHILVGLTFLVDDG